MKASCLTTMSKFGKFYSNQSRGASNQIIKSIELKQIFQHKRPLTICKFNLNSNKLYFIDSAGILTNLNLQDNTISALKDERILDFTIDGLNSYNILLVNKKSQLLRVSFQNKKTTKIANLNLSKILAFEKNFLRQLLLVLDYKVLYLYDLINTNKNKSLKAMNHEIFTNACFASNNRFLILAVKNIEIRVLEIMNLQTLQKIRLPFQIEDLHIQISHDSKKIAIYGKSNIIIFISLKDNNAQLSYQLAKLPNIKSIRQLRYTFQGDIVFLANDQVIYAISNKNLKRMVPIFNTQQQISLMGFDISLDTKRMAVVSNRTVFIIKWIKGLNKFIQKIHVWRDIQFGSDFKKTIRSKQLRPEEQQVNSYQYNQQSEQEEEDDSITKYNFLDLLDESIMPQIEQLHEQNEQIKSHLQQLYTNIFQDSNASSAGILRQYRRQFLMLLLNIYKLKQNNPHKTQKMANQIIKNIAVQNENFERYARVFIPEIIQITDNSIYEDVNQFATHKMCSLFRQYANDDDQWEVMLDWIVSKKDKSMYSSILFITILQQVVKKLQRESIHVNFQIISGLDPEQLNIETDINILFEKVEKILNSKEYELLQQHHNAQTDSKDDQQQSITVVKQQTLQVPIEKQERIKNELNNI